MRLGEVPQVLAPLDESLIVEVLLRTEVVEVERIAEALDELRRIVNTAQKTASSIHQDVTFAYLELQLKPGGATIPLSLVSRLTRTVRLHLSHDHVTRTTQRTTVDSALARSTQQRVVTILQLSLEEVYLNSEDAESSLEGRLARGLSAAV